MENSNQTQFVCGADFSFECNEYTTIIVMKVHPDKTVEVIESAQMKCQKYDDQRRDSEFSKTLEQLIKKYNAVNLGPKQSFRKLDQKLERHQATHKLLDKGTFKLMNRLIDEGINLDTRK